MAEKMAARAVNRYQLTRYRVLDARSIAESFTDIMARKRASPVRPVANFGPLKLS
jgi:hypothetical protein